MNENALVAALRELLLARAAGRIDAAEFEKRQAALHAAVLDNPATTSAASTSSERWRFALALAVIAVAGGLYGWLGTPNQLSTAPTAVPMQSADGAAPADGQNHNAGDLAVLVKRLAEKMEKDPKNGEGWALLAHSYLELRQHKEADAAFAHAAPLVPPDATFFADWADAHVVANDRKWDKKAGELVQKALATDPKNLKALALAGSEAFDAKRYKEAVVFWKRMQAAAPADSMEAKLAAANIEEAEAVLSGKPLPTEPAPALADVVAAAVAAPAASPVAAPASSASVSGTVTVPAALKAKAAATDTVFVVVKTPDNSGPPLAVKRFTAAELPASFSLSDGDAMMPNRKLSGFGEVILIARLSKSGNAMPQPGDLASAPQKVKLGASGIKLELSAVQ